MRVNKIADFVDRVGWTALQAGAAAAITALTSSDLTWQTGLKFVGTAALLAALKVVTAQNASPSGDGSAIPGGVQESTYPVAAGRGERP